MPAATAHPSPSAHDNAPAWSDPELANPHLNADKSRKVREMFAAIADSYDLNNRVHSLGREFALRKFEC